MGIGSSTTSQLVNNKYLQELSSTNTISEYDPFWNQLFSFPASLKNQQSSAVALQEVAQKYCTPLFANNQRTGNFTSLIKVFISRSKELKASAECGDEIFVWQTQNALYIIRQLCKFLVENMTEDKIIEQFEACSLDERKKELSTGSVFTEVPHFSLFKDFLSMLMDILIDVPILHSTYMLVVESVNCFIILLSVQMFIANPLHHGPLHNIIFADFDSSKINNFVHSLFLNFVAQRAPPNKEDEEHGGGSFVLGLASSVATGLRSILNLPASTETKDSMTMIQNTLLAHQCALLALVLISHHSSAGSDFINVYKQAMCSFRHVQGRQKGAESQNDKQNSPSFHINLSRLYETLCKTQALESGTLMLYFLLHNNPDVKAYILSKTDIENLVLPILHILYIAPTQNSHHIYMALIVLLMLTEDDHFNKSIHVIKLPQVSWYTERLLSEVSLGDVMILVILRTIQFNMYQLRDRYLHTNCLAALANMSSQFRSIHAYPSQKIFELVSALTKRHRLYKLKLTEPQTSSHPEPQATLTIEPERNYVEEVQILEEVIRMLLEIVNSCLSIGIHRQNYHLVYALLQKRDIFLQLKKYPSFADVLQNIETIIEFFGGMWCSVFIVKGINEFRISPFIFILHYV